MCGDSSSSPSVRRAEGIAACRCLCEVLGSNFGRQLTEFSLQSAHVTYGLHSLHTARETVNEVGGGCQIFQTCPSRESMGDKEWKDGI